MNTQKTTICIFCLKVEVLRMNHRQWKKSYTKRYGIRPIIFLDKKRKDKAMSLIRAWKEIASNIHIPDGEYYRWLGEYYTNSLMIVKLDMLESWERK